MIAYLYVMESLERGDFKIGLSIDPYKRKCAVERDYPGDRLWLRVQEPFSETAAAVWVMEKILHEHFDDRRSQVRERRGVEWFALSPDDVEVVKAACVCYRDAALRIDDAFARDCVPAALRAGTVVGWAETVVKDAEIERLIAKYREVG